MVHIFSLGTRVGHLVRPLQEVYCPVGGALELSCCLSYEFLLVFVPVLLVDVRQDLLFYACQFHPFCKGTSRVVLSKF